MRFWSQTSIPIALGAKQGEFFRNGSERFEFNHYLCDNNTMGKKLSFIIYAKWFDGLLRRNSYPSLEKLREAFELPLRTAQRVIEDMRDMGAPIVYSRTEKGYYYSESSFELPKVRFTEKEVMGLIVADCLSHTIPDKRMLKEIDTVVEKFSTITGINVNKLKEKISIKNMRCDRVEPTVFEAVIDALNKGKKLWVVYKSKNTEETTTRTINPFHLLLYKGNWHLFAFCEKRKEQRNFALSGIQKFKILDTSILPDLPKGDFKKLIEDNYGIYIHESGTQKVNVVLKFSRKVAERLRAQVWFPIQDVQEDEDGSIVLTFPVTDLREIESDILDYGADVEVLEPPALRQKMKDTIEKMKMLY